MHTALLTLCCRYYGRFRDDSKDWTPRDVAVMDNGIQTLHGVLANLRAEQVRLVRVCVSFIALTFTQEKKDLHLKSVRVDANGVVLPEWAERYEYWTQRRAECDALINATSTFCLLHTHTHMCRVYFFPLPFSRFGRLTFFSEIHRGPGEGKEDRHRGQKADAERPRKGKRSAQETKVCGCFAFSTTCAAVFLNLYLTHVHRSSENGRKLKKKQRLREQRNKEKEAAARAAAEGGEVRLALEQ